MNSLKNYQFLLPIKADHPIVLPDYFLFLLKLMIFFLIYTILASYAGFKVIV